MCVFACFFGGEGRGREVKQDPLFRQYEFFYCLIFSASKTSALLDLEGPLEFDFFYNDYLTVL